MKFLKVLVASALLSAFTAVRLPVSAAPLSSAQVATVSYLAWLPPARQTQAATFENLTYDARYQVQLPSYPETGLLGWSLRRYHIVPASNPKALYALVYEDLLIAQKLLTGTNLARQREGMHLALNAERCAHVTLKDNPLSANIYEGFLLPYLSGAYPEKWQDLSRQQIVEGAESVYAENGETQKQIALLQLYLSITAHQTANQNDADWARGQLAQTLAGQGRYGKAIALLQAIQTPNMAFKQLIPSYQVQWDKQKQQKQKQKKAKT